MLRSTKAYVLAAMAALVALASLSGIASASTEFTLSGGAIESPSIGKLTFEAEGTNIECNVTLNGRMRAATATRIAGGTMGEINEVRIRECVGAGEIERVLIETPWTVTSTRALQGAGTLPDNYTGGLFTINRTKFRFSIFFGVARCLYEGNAGALTPFTRTARATYTTGNVTALETSVFRQVGEAFGCPETGIMRGTFRLTRQTVTVR